KVAILTEGVLKAMLLSKLKTTTVGLLLVALLIGAAGALYRTQAAEQPKAEQRGETVAPGKAHTPPPAPPAPPRDPRPPPGAPSWLKYTITSRLMEAGAERPKEVLCLPKVTLEDGQPCDSGIVEDSSNWPLQSDEKIKIGTFFHMRVKRLRGNQIW